MSLEVAADRLAQLARQPLRRYSTFDFGRARDESARSVVVAEASAEQVLRAVRRELVPGVVAFIGTTNWLGEEQHKGCSEIVVASGESQFDILRVARSDAVNFGMETEDLVRKLRSYHEAYGIDIFHAETDTIEFVLSRFPEPLSAFCADLYEFCPDIVDQGVGTVEGLEDEIRARQRVFLWWD